MQKKRHPWIQDRLERSGNDSQSVRGEEGVGGELALTENQQKVYDKSLAVKIRQNPFLFSQEL